MNVKSRRLSHPFLAFLVFAFIFEALIAKSLIFVGNDPVLEHYIASALISIIIICVSINKINFRLIYPWPIFFLFFAVVWALFSSTQSQNVMNYVYVLSFILLYTVCIFCCPGLILKSGYSISDIVFPIFLILGVISILFYFFFNTISIDPASGRFQGAYISVANAGTMFSFISIFAIKYFCENIVFKNIKYYNIVWFILGLYLIFLTKTRSTLLETILICLIIYVAYFKMHFDVFRQQILLALSLLFLVLAIAGYAVSSGALNDASVDFRLEGDTSIAASRTGNWEFGIERILAKPLFGEGMLAKQTQGGTASLDVEGAGSYDPLYDPHSLVLSFGVQAGIPFAVCMLALILGILVLFVSRVGWAAALTRPEFVYCSVHTITMFFAGGDLTSLGSLGDRVYLIMLGVLYISCPKSPPRAIQHHRARSTPRRL
jgi:O-Antigen ligase